MDLNEGYMALISKGLDAKQSEKMSAVYPKCEKGTCIIYANGKVMILRCKVFVDVPYVTVVI